MVSRFQRAFIAVALVGGVANVAASAVVEIEAGDAATFRWAPASGPVDHYEIQVATQDEPPFDWTLYGVTDSAEPVVSIGNGAVGAAPPDVAHWAFDENAGATATDWSGNGHSGSLAGAGWLTDTPSGRGSALRFDGLNDSVELGGVDVGGQSLTIALWFKADDFEVSDGRLISKASGMAERHHYWMLSTTDSDGPKLRFRVRAGGDTRTLLASSGTLSPGVWTHAAVVYDGAAMRIYKDGVEVGSTGMTGALATSSSVLAAIGDQPSGAGSAPFDGAIDDVRIYEQALTQPEIAALAGGVLTGAEWLTIRTVAVDAVGNTSLSSAASATLHFIPAVVRADSVPDDFDGDAIADVLSHDAGTGQVVLEESASGDEISLSDEMGEDWEIVAQGDFDGDSREDLFWRNLQTGDNRLWLEVGQDLIEQHFDGSPELARSDPAWQVLASGDFDGDGLFDVFWQNADTGYTSAWFMDGATAQLVDFPRVSSTSWGVEASADFDGSGTHDLFWRSIDDGETAVWLMDGDRVAFASSEVADAGLEVVDVLDRNDDGSMDLIWQGEQGDCEIWLMSGGDRITDPTPIGSPACPSID